MSVLIEEFKKEHSKIIEALKEVEKLGVITKKGNAKLTFLLPDLLDHLWDEDDQLYPVLRKASEHNKRLKEILSSFVNGLGAIHEELLTLMTKYAKEVVKDSNFQREYERLSESLGKRIEYEEKILYDEYNKLT